MYGPTTEPPPAQQPLRGGERAMGVFFASFPVWSCGLLAWLPSLRIALLRMRRVDWLVFAGVVVLNAGHVTVVMLLPGPDEEESVVWETLGALYCLAFIVGCVVHGSLAGRTPTRLSAPRPAAAPYAPSPYPAPYPGSLAGPVPHQAGGPAPHQPGPAHAGPHHPVPPYPAPPHPSGPPPASASPRQRQVHSELDELGERLRQRGQQ